ncbi:GNAT family N-acetyltransferase [Roseicyclus persicicus]|uniref:GNAT family N-acetyltransferase n=1 Tax=Roseicyclus persicicus TaxID=2650661 RepID=A0A7X6GYA0_9RHOB|nr:GNAT family N-acetyltransferase [Roseibacterium persicicum]NKX44634.1 GNAT family N-acetyltransferase [Roseibacterium persicicum]
MAGRRDGAGAPQTTVIRAARVDDRPALHALFEESWLSFWAPHLPPGAEERFRARDPVTVFLDEALDRIEVAEVEGAVVGALLVEGDRLEDLHVVQSRQGEGIGRLLFTRAKTLGARRLEVRAFNTRAIAFYDHMGWHRARTFETTELGYPVLTHEYVEQGALQGGAS